MKIIPDPIPRRPRDFTLTMINIVFLLLLFFLITGSLTNQNEAQTAVPETQTLPLERLPRPLLLIQQDGGLFVDGRPIEDSDLPEAARAALNASGQQTAPLNVLAQREMPASEFLAVAKRLRVVGVGLRIVTIRQPAATAASSP